MRKGRMMAWVVGIFLFILLLFAFPAFRVFAVGALLILVIGGVAWWQSNEQSDRRAKTLIPKTDVEFEVIKLFYDYSYKLSGTLKNNNGENILSGVNLIVQARDCPTNIVSPECTIIGEDDVYIITNIPPHQARTFDTHVSFYNMPSVKGTFVWSYSVTGTRARI